MFVFKIPKLRTVLPWVGMITAFVLLIYFYLPGHAQFYELKRKEEKLDLKIQNLEKEIERMKKEKHLLENDVLYLEKIVRENLGRVEPGETVYKVIEDKTPGYEILERDEEGVTHGAG